MNKMLNLIRNENMKTRKRIGTWLMFGFIVLFVLYTTINVKYMRQAEAGNADWKATLSQQNAELEKTNGNPGTNFIIKEKNSKQIQLNNYRIEHDLPPVSEKSLWGHVQDNKNLTFLLTLFVIIIGASSVANEFTSGAIKLLLIRPVKRWKILFSKYITMLMYAFLMVMVLFASSFVSGLIFFGPGGISQPYLAIQNGQVVETNIVLQTLLQYGLSCVNMLMLVTLTFMISAIFRNNAIAIGLGVFLNFAGGMIVSALKEYDWIKYFLFANTNLALYIDGAPPVGGMTMTFSIIVLIVYFLIFNFISWYSFTKRDVAV